MTARATCPVCGLTGIPLTNGLLAAHAWHRGTWADGPDDENGDPTPGEWRAGATTETRTGARLP